MDLPGLDEPVGLRARAATDPDAVRARLESGRLVLTPLWKAWGPALGAAGIDRAAFSAILRGYSYELWLWAAGERTWTQCLEGLAGRVNRRVGASRAGKRGVTRRAPTRAAKAAKAGKAKKKITKATKATTVSRSGGASRARPARATKSARSAKTRRR